MGMSLEEMKNIDVRTVNPETLVDDGVIIRIEFQGMRKAPVLRV